MARVFPRQRRQEAHGGKSDGKRCPGRGSGFADRMVFSNKVRFPGPRKKQPLISSGLRKLQLPESGGQSVRARPATCEWPRLSRCIGGLGVRGWFDTTREGRPRKRGWPEERDWSGHRGGPASREIYEAERQKDLWLQNCRWSWRTPDPKSPRMDPHRAENGPPARPSCRQG